MSHSLLARIEKLTAIGLSVVVIFLLIARAQHAGSMWRDECGLVQLSQLPNFGAIFDSFPPEAFPPLFASLVRLWTKLFGAHDAALRCFGALVGVLFVSVAWFNSRRLGDDV